MKYIPIILFLLAVSVLSVFTFKHFSLQGKEKVVVTNLEIKNLTEDQKKKKKAIEMILLSKDLYFSKDWGTLLKYVKATNDQGEISDFKSASKLDIDEAIKLESEGKMKNVEVYVIGAPIINNIESYAFLSEDFFFHNFFSPGDSILDSKFDSMWHISYDKNFEGTTYMLAFEGAIVDGKYKQALSTFGAILKDSGEWRALPVAAFRLE